MRIAIIGGGIGGLTTALALRQFGFEPEVFEQAPDLREVGAAILMWPNAMRVLHRLGVADMIRERGAVLEKGCWLDRDGRLINQFRMPAAEVPAIALHRADLQNILLNALPSDSIHLGKTLQSYEQLSAGIVAHFSDRSLFESDVLIAADGVHSRARTQLLNDGLPTDRGYVAWRGVASYTPASIPPATAIEIYGPGQRFGIGPMGSGKAGWWASSNESIKGADAGTTRNELLRLFDGWWPPVLELIEATPSASLIRNDVCDRPPRRGWSAGAITLLGDAIHPTTPNLGQGGGLAIEDAAVLARCLHKYRSEGQISIALRRFESVRFARTAAVVRYSRVYGMIAQWERSWAVQVRRFTQSLIPPQLIERCLAEIFKYDAYAVRV
jgi:2-polyprenyl-6-methoxyphenol hydroxylase-like FAD-dependent oxidoreductase